MSTWTRDPTTNRLLRSPTPKSDRPRVSISSSSSTLDFGDFGSSLFSPQMDLEARANMRAYVYPTRVAQPSCIVLPPTNANNFELKPSMLSLLPKFSGTEDPYLFIREFEEGCQLVKLQQLNDDAIRLRLIPFCLKDNAKKWLYSRPPGSIATWNQFTVQFLQKFFPNSKTNRLRNEIGMFRQKENEPFCTTFDRFQDLLNQCPHHGFEIWRLNQIIYSGLTLP